MRANWISHAVSAGGTGTLTLTTDGAWAKLTDVFGTSGTLVCEYEVDDGTNYEAGLGSLVLSTGVLTRTEVRETWDGTTYTTASASALNVGSGAKVRVTPQARGLMPTVHAVWSAQGQGVFLPGNCADGAPTNTVVFAASTIYYVPFYHDKTFAVGKAGVFVNTTQASTTVRVGLYRLGTDGAPDVLVADFGTLSTASSTMVTNSSASWTTPSSNFFLPPGWYWAAFASNANTTAVYAGSDILTFGPAANSFDRGARYYTRGSFTYGAFNASAASNGSGGYSAISNQTAPILYLGP